MTYTYPFWVPLATTCLGVAVGVAGVRLPDLDDLLRWIFWGGALLLLLASPWLLTYSVTVDPEGFSISGLLEDRTVRFDDVTSIRFRVQIRGAGDSERITEYMIFERGSRGTLLFEKSNFPEPAYDQIIRIAEAKGIPMRRSMAP